jgi:Arc/MetJ family transcription regulator
MVYYNMAKKPVSYGFQGGVMETAFVKKTMFLNKAFIQRARTTLNTKTERETVNRALEIIVEESEIIQAHKAVGGVGDIEAVYK